jgi:chorismate synthase
MKPISTLMQPLQTVDLNTGETAYAVRERSDVCALPAAAVVGEAMVALVVADAMLETFGSGSLGDIRERCEVYLRRLEGRHGRA